MRTSDPRDGQSPELDVPDVAPAPHATGAAIRPLDVLVAADVGAVIDTIGRTEDIALSPDGTRLLIAGFQHDVLALVAFELDSSNSRQPIIELTGITIITDPLLSQPHGVEFIDDTTVLVANRASEVLLIEVPSPDSGRFGSHRVRSSAKVLLDHQSPAPVRTPGSLAIRRFGDIAEVVVCNNYVHDVTRHVIDLGGSTNSPRVIDHEVLLSSGLQIPDGVAISPSGNWLAISNHVTHEVLMYRHGPDLTPDSLPCGRFTHVNFPHGLVFSADERHLLVADAGLPYVHVYRTEDGDWSGDRRPIRVVRLMDDDTFNRGRYNPQEGGPKGLAFVTTDVIVATSEFQTLGFFSRHDLFPGHVTPVTGDDVGRSVITRAMRRLTDATGAIDQLQARLEASEGACAAVVASNFELVEANAAANEQLAGRDSQVADLVETCEALRAELAAATQRHATLVDEFLSSSSSQSSLAAQAITLHDLSRAQAEERAARATAAADAIAGSTSWRITRPARAVLDLIRRTRV